jgi:pimeloyl-ACP methyl ester carboxylesterase
VFCALAVMERELPHARVVVFRGAGHGLPAQRPAPFTDTLMDFLHDVEEGVDIAGRRTV